MNIKRKKTVLKLILFAILTLMLSGCMSVLATKQETAIWLDGDFQKGIDIIEENISQEIREKNVPENQIASYAHYDKSFGGQYDHAALCYSYSSIRNYDKFEQCRDSWFKREEQANIESQVRKGHCVNMNMVMQNDAISCDSAILLMEQGRKDESLLWMEKAQQYHQVHLECLENSGSKEANTSWYATVQKGFAETEGEIYAKSGQKDKTRKSIQAIDNLPHYSETQTQFAKTAKAKLYMLLEDYEEVIKELTDSRGEYVTFEKETDYYKVKRRFLLARSLFLTKRYSEARRYYEELTYIPYTKYHGSIYFVILHDLAMIELKAGNSAKAIEMLGEAVAVIESQRNTLNTETGKIGFVGDKQKVYADLVLVLIEAGQVEAALEYAEKAKSRALVDMLAEKKRFGGGSGQTENSALLKELDRLETRERQKGSSKKVVSFGSKLRGSIEDKRIEIKNTFPELASLVSVDTLDHKEIQRQLGKDETLLEFYGNDDFFVAFIVNKDAIKAVKLDMEKAGPLVTLFRDQILDYNSKGYSDTARKLYREIFSDIASHIKTKKLTIVAHGSFHYLPFNALHDGNSFLIDNYSIRMLPSASVMKFLGKNTNKDDSILVLANPDLGNTQYDLPAAELEGQAIAKGNARANVLSRKAATETALRKYGSTISRLHIASHGQFKAEAPLKSRLLLAGDNENDGSLTVDELYNLELNNDLVVLSACETGLGDVKNGDDVIGLTRGFLFAGADSIVSSLWVVDDVATANLMVAFYDGLESNSKQEALRQAQLKIKNEYNEHPFFWAAFQLTGDI